MRRSLVLAGGGAKIGWASGALQVLMDEANLKFDHIDATSGSVFNLGMLLSGKSATHVAQVWADLAPREFVSLHPAREYVTFWRLPSLLTQDAAVTRIMPKWGIDLDRIRSCTEVNGHPVTATFNVVDFGAKTVKTIPHTQMDLDYFLAVDAVPGVVPPIRKDGTLYTDAMLLKDANLSEAVRQGADEIWVLWTVEDRAEWRGGFWNHLGHVFETCAVASLKHQLAEIERVNRRVADGTAEPGQRHVTVHLLEPDGHLPVHYLFYRSKRQMRPVIESGRSFMREYLAERGYLTPREPRIGDGIRFTGTMTGQLAPAGSARRAGELAARGTPESRSALEFTLTITVADVERFLEDPDHQATATGVVRAPFFGGACAVTRGWFNLLVREAGGPRRMEYELEFKTAQDRRYVLKGVKILHDDGGRLWRDITTLEVVVEEAGAGERVGAGVLRISPRQFLRQLTTFEAVGTNSKVASAQVLARFGRFFLGGLWDTYGPLGASA